MPLFDIFVDEVELKEHVSVSPQEENSSLWLPASPPDAPATLPQFLGRIRSQEIMTRHVIFSKEDYRLDA